MSQAIAPEIMTGQEKMIPEASENGKVYYKLASLLPIEYIPVFSLHEAAVQEEESLADDVYSKNNTSLDKFPQAHNSEKCEVSVPFYKKLHHIENYCRDVSDVRRTVPNNKLKITRTSRGISNSRSAPYKLSKGSRKSNSLKSTNNDDKNAEFSKEIKLEIITDVMQYIQNLQNLLDCGSTPKNDKQNKSTSSSSENKPTLATEQHVEKLVEPTSNSETDHEKLPPRKFEPSLTKPRLPQTTHHLAISSTYSEELAVSSTYSKDLAKISACSKEDSNMKLLEFQTGAIALSA